MVAYKGFVDSQSDNSLARRGVVMNIPNDITPMAESMPEFTVSSGVLKDPRSSEGTKTPWITTVTRMTIMLIKASVLALASFSRVSMCLAKIQ